MSGDALSGAVSGAALAGVRRRAERAGAARAERARRAIAAAAGAMGGIAASVEGEDVVLAGRNLLERWLVDAELRDIGREVGRALAAGRGGG